MEKIDLTSLSNEEAFGFVYEIYAKEFLLSNTWDEFINEITPTYELTRRQISFIETEWKIKEGILKEQ